MVATTVDMKTTMNSILSAQFAGLIENVQRSLVVIQGPHHGAGAGIIWHADGLILTNNHVLNQLPVRVTLADNREMEASVMVRAPEVDLAVLKIEAEDLPAAKIGDSTAARVGEMVFAIGHPWGQRGAVTAGIISHLTTAESGRKNKRLIPVIRTDSRLAPGNSGGPLVNASGEVLGINTMIVGGDQAIAIPTAVALDLLENLPDKRRTKQHKNAERWL